jgi:hypothetical protein
VLNLAIPLFVNDASSPEITPELMSIPSPGVNEPEIPTAVKVLKYVTLP